MIEAALFALLSADPAVAALAGVKLFPLAAPQNTAAPFVTYQRIATTRVSSLDGPSGLAQVRFQIDSWAPTYATARQLADAVRTRLDGFRGLVTTTAGVAAIGGVTCDTEQDARDTSADPPLFRAIQDFLIWHDE